MFSGLIAQGSCPSDREKKLFNDSPANSESGKAAAVVVAGKGAVQPWVITNNFGKFCCCVLLFTRHFFPLQFPVPDTHSQTHTNTLTLTCPLSLPVAL